LIKPCHEEGLGAFRASPAADAVLGSPVKEPVMSGKLFSTATSASWKPASWKPASWKIAARLVATTIRDAARATIRAMANRSSVNTLAAMDDRMLRDIGLTRGDVESALAQPWHKDPSRVLTVRRIENRVRRMSAPVAASKRDVDREQGRVAGDARAPENCS
jgi:uncharacterized protein YjiS (DUF1127 family)